MPTSRTKKRKKNMEVVSENTPPELLDHITVECKVCGMPLNLPWSSVGGRTMDEMLMRVAQGTVHSHCYLKRHKQVSEQEENQRILQRAADFRLLCPPQYHDSEQWLATDAASRLKHDSIKRALQWAYGPMGLTLHGKVSGTGKTTTAWLILKREFMASRFIVAMTHKEMSDKATWMAKELTPESKRWNETLKSCDLLFIDDLGKARFKGVNGEGRASEEFLFDVIDARIRNKLPTIFTVNMTGKEIALAMSTDKGAYFVRRLREFFTNVGFDAVTE